LTPDSPQPINVFQLYYGVVCVLVFKAHFARSEYGTLMVGTLYVVSCLHLFVVNLYSFYLFLVKAHV